MLEDVLAVARAPAHTPDQLHELRMQSVNADLVRPLLARLDDLRVDFLTRLVDDLFDSAWVNSAIRHQLFERESRHFAADRIEAGHDNRVRCIVDDDVDAGCELEGADVSA